MVIESGRVRASTEDMCGEGDDAEGHQTGVPDGTEKVRRSDGETGDHHQRNDGRQRTSTIAAKIITDLTRCSLIVFELI